MVIKMNTKTWERMMREDGWNTLRLTYKDAHKLLENTPGAVITPDDVINIWFRNILEAEIYYPHLQDGQNGRKFPTKYYVTTEEGTYIVLVMFGESHFVVAMKDKRFYDQSVPNVINGD